MSSPAKIEARQATGWENQTRGHHTTWGDIVSQIIQGECGVNLSAAGSSGLNQITSPILGHSHKLIGVPQYV